MHFEERRVPDLQLTEDEAAYTLALLLVRADGRVDADEQSRLAQEWRAYAEARGMDSAAAQSLADRCHALYDTMGAKILVDACERALRASSRLEEVVQMALQVAYADGELSDAERAHLSLILELLGIHADDLPRAGPGGGRRPKRKAPNL